MLQKCINCCKWITCNDTSSNKNSCEKFYFKRIDIKYCKNIIIKQKAH